MINPKHNMLHELRCGCEHFAIAGALADIFVTYFRIEWMIVVLLVKAAWFLGGLSVILARHEEEKLEDYLKREARDIAVEAAKEARGVA
jgi:hypothetical protein